MHRERFPVAHGATRLIDWIQANDDRHTWDCIDILDVGYITRNYPLLAPVDAPAWWHMYNTFRYSDFGDIFETAGGLSTGIKTLLNTN